MNKKVLLILSDGMRPDGMLKANHPYMNKMLENSIYSMETNSVMPSVTLPCHMSLFHSVEPGRHGILTNTYTPQVRPVDGLCEQLHKFSKTSALFYNWEELRDLARPGSTARNSFYSGYAHGYPEAIKRSTEDAADYIKNYRPDFVFLYLGLTDEVGHGKGWMTDEYIQSIYDAWDCIEKIHKTLDDEYVTIVTADHGGHDRSHGTEMPEDMLIPLIISSNEFVKTELKASEKPTSIIDIAPTVTKIIGVEPNRDWVGKSII